MKYFAFTLDLESDYDGCIKSDEILKDPEKIEAVLAALTSRNVKITVFTVGRLFKSYPDVIRMFENYGCEFEAHSYSHDFNNPDSEIEITKSREAYHDYFGTYPRGYRSPRGLITPSGIKSLDKNGFFYDSSIFPSYFPNPFRYLFCDKHIHYHKNSTIMEIPFSSVSPFRLTLSISYIKLFGISFFIRQELPEIICFDAHLHDFIINDNSFNKLSLFWRLLYGRNKFNGLELCLKYLEHIQQKGYQFCYMSELYEMHKRNSSPSVPDI